MTLELQVNRKRRVALAGSVVLATAFLAGTTASAQVPVTIVVKENDTPTGAPGPVTSVRVPTVNGLGQVGFTGIAGGVQFVWYDTAIVWLDTDATTHVLGLGDNDRMGISDTMGFVYAPSVDGDAGLWTDAGLLLQAGDPVPNAAGVTFDAFEDPMMLPNGDVYFMPDLDTDADGFAEAEAFFMVPAGMGGASATPVYLPGDTIGAFTLSATFPFDDNAYDVSPNGMHHIVTAFLGNADTVAIVDGTVVMVEGTPTGGGDNWSVIDYVAINDSGHHVVGGDTDGPFATDDFIAYDGAIAVRSGDTVGGVTVAGEADAVAINGLGNVVYAWNEANTGDDLLLRACDGADIANTTDLIAKQGDAIDVDADGVADGTFEGLNTDLGPSFGAGDDGFLYANVDVDLGTGAELAIARFDIACCGDGLVGGNEDCDDAGESATCNADCTATSCGDFIVNATAGEECDDGGIEGMFCDTDCTFPACGDGVQNTLAGEDCDDGGESATCDSDCTPAECGDGLLNAAAGEVCEDGNMDDGDGCSSTCQFEGDTSTTTGAGGGGTGGGAGVGGGDTGVGGDAPVVIEADGGCGCRVAGDGGDDGAPWRLGALLALAGAALARRRRG